MPYTPPAHSPASSKPTTPLLTRNNARLNLPSTSPRTAAARPSLPRSTSSTAYLQKHRRSPSWQQPQTARRAYDEDQRPATADHSLHGDAISSLRQSPPPVTDNTIPAGAIISPPDSQNNSSDDDEDNGRGRRRETSEELDELSEAVHRSLDVKRSGSPTTEDEASKKTENLKLSIPSSDMVPQSTHPVRPALSQSARKISHSRSNTESSILNLRSTQSARTSRTNSDDSDTDEDTGSKPPLLRKKSGELVKPALRGSSRRRPSSMPGTPTYSKAVHFNDDIEQVRHFLQVDRPIAVSAGSSPADPFDDETEFPFGVDDSHGRRPTEWEIKLTNFPRDDFGRLSLPVKVERIFLSADNKTLIGAVAVANLAFTKFVVARFTLDYWKTTSEIVAEYNNDIRQKPREDGYDQFNFNIKLADQANLEKKTLLLCVRYNVNGQEYWDNNNDMNFIIDFSKKAKAKPEKPAVQQQGLGARPLGAIPRSRHSGSASVGRPRSMPTFDDDFARSFDDGEDSGPGIRLKNPIAGRRFLPDTPPSRQQAAGQPFGNRYDFGASLSAALSQAQATLGERSGLTGRVAPTVPPAGSTLAPRSGPAVPATSGTESPRPDTLLADSKTLDSRAYQEFVSKFCFFGSAKPGPAPKTNSKALNGDGADDEDQTTSSSVTDSSQSSGANTPRLVSYNISGELTSTQESSSRTSRSISPSPMAGTVAAERPASPASFGYPYIQPGMFTPDSQTPTAIQG